MRTIILSTLLNLLLIFTSCDGQQNRIVTSIAEEPLQLENLDFEILLSEIIFKVNIYPFNTVRHPTFPF